MQALPGQAKNLNAKANIRGDNAVSVLLGHFPLNADLFAGPNPAGPVPLFFAPHPERTLQLLNENPEDLRHDISLINSQLLHMEHLSVAEAHAYLQSRARAAKGSTAFPHIPGPPTKKQRTAAGPFAPTGKFLHPVKHKIRIRRQFLYV